MVTLPLKFSLNQYERAFYIKRNQIKQQFYLAVRTAKREGTLSNPPYAVQYHFLMWGFKLDVSNLMGMVKPLEDGLVRCGILEDDNINIVKSLTLTEETAPESSKKTKLSYCIITIKPHSEAK